MLRISVHDSRKQRHLVVEGKVTAPWIEELRTAQMDALSSLGGRQLVVELRDVTAISDDGEDALLNLMRSGAQFRSSGVFTKHIVRNLLRKKDEASGISAHGRGRS